MSTKSDVTLLDSDRRSHKADICLGHDNYRSVSAIHATITKADDTDPLAFVFVDSSTLGSYVNNVFIQ